MYLDDEKYYAATRGRDSTSQSQRDSLLRTIPDFTKTCLLDAYDTGLSPDGCMLEFLSQSRRRKKKREDYFVYTRATGVELALSPMIDACEVYTGTQAFSQEFSNCMEGDAGGGASGKESCNIPSFVWSGRSTNRVPVANYHAYLDPDPIATATRIHAEVSDRMTDIISSVRQSFTTTGLRAMLFSTEGDALHQLMDCIFMGPFASMDYGARGLRNDLPIPFYSRSSAAAADLISRDFELPCDASKMQGDTQVNLSVTFASQYKNTLWYYTKGL